MCPRHQGGLTGSHLPRAALAPALYLRRSGGDSPVPSCPSHHLPRACRPAAPSATTGSGGETQHVGVHRCRCGPALRIFRKRRQHGPGEPLREIVPCTTRVGGLLFDMGGANLEKAALRKRRSAAFSRLAPPMSKRSPPTLVVHGTISRKGSPGPC